MTEHPAPYEPTTTAGVPVRILTLSDHEQAEGELWSRMRESLLAMVDAIERFRHISPRTAELRRQARQGQ